MNGGPAHKNDVHFPIRVFYAEFDSVKPVEKSIEIFLQFCWYKTKTGAVLTSHVFYAFILLMHGK